jgi:hypothetical protein
VNVYKARAYNETVSIYYTSRSLLDISHAHNATRCDSDICCTCS